MNIKKIRRMKMNIKKTYVLLLVICLVGSFFLIPLNYQQAYASEPIKIGVLLPVTGPFAMFGQESLRGIEIAKDVQNAKGGINGREIVYIIKDAPDTNSAIAAAEKLISEGVNIVVAGMISSISYTIAPICERNKVISWHVNASSSNLTQQGYKYLFRTSATSADAGKAMVRFAYEAAPKIELKPEEVRVAIVFEDGVYGTEIAKSIKINAEKLGLKNIVFEASYNGGTKDLSSLVIKLKKAKPDILLLSSYQPDTKLFIREAMKLDLKIDVVIGTGSSIGTEWFRDTYGDGAKGLFAENWSIENTPEEVAPGMKEFVELYREKTGRDHLASCHSYTGYTGMLILWDVLKRTENLDDVESIRKAALETDIPSRGVGWGAKFAPPGDPMMGTNLRAQDVVTQWQDGELWTVWPAPYPGRNPILPMQNPNCQIFN